MEFRHSTSSIGSSNDTPDILQTLLAKFTLLEERMTALSEKIGETTPASVISTGAAAAAIEPVAISRPPATVQANRSSATCKPPREPSLTGDKQYEWQEFEREFSRYLG